MPDLDDDYDNRHYREIDSMDKAKKQLSSLINPDALFDDPEAVDDEEWPEDYEWD